MLLLKSRKDELILVGDPLDVDKYLSEKGKSEEYIRDLLENDINADYKIIENDVEDMVEYIKREIRNSETWGKERQVKIDFTDLCSEDEVLQAAAELALKAEETSTTGVWRLYEEE